MNAMSQPARSRRTNRSGGVRLLLAALVAAITVWCCSSALAQNFTGTYLGSAESGQVTVELSMAGEELLGRLSAQGFEFTLEGVVQDGVGAGLAYTAEGSVGFEAYLEGDTLGLYLFEMDANGAPIVESVIELTMTRQAAGATGGTPASSVGAPTPAGAPSKQVAGATVAPQQAHDEVLAAGAHATLTTDNALAFIEALEFVLAEIGYAYTFTEADRAEALTSIAAAYPTMQQMDQVVLSQAREVWERVKVNWASAATSEQEEFALGVLILAFGEQTVSTWVGPSGGGGGQGLGGGSCATFEDCTSSFVDEQTWTDTFNAQGCWAAAGCSGFDASTNSFDYDGY